MKLAVIGKGKTGWQVVTQANAKHSVEVFDSKRIPTALNLQGFDAGIVFVPPTIFADISSELVKAKIPLVIGTTGFDFSKIQNLQAPWIVASNFSKGMNLMFSIAKLVDEFQQQHPELQLGVKEIHHTEKKDKPSGTALFLQKLFAKTPNIEAVREGDVKGMHSLQISLPGETLEIRHDALSRDVFAAGALWAAEKLLKRPPGLYQFETLLSQLPKDFL